MGTRADFYTGRGESAEWLGSIAWDGYPSGIPTELLGASTEDAFRTALAAFGPHRDDWTAPEMGWPWPWDTSHTTDYAYAFDGGHVWGSCFGGAWFDGREDEPDDKAGPCAVFPDMTERKNVTYGKRSGVMFISAPSTPEGGS
jgi:hypothetical protein